MKKIRFILIAAFLCVATSINAQFMNATNAAAPSAEIKGWDGVKISALQFAFDESGVDIDKIWGASFSYSKGLALSKRVPLFMESGLELQYVAGDLIDEYEYQMSLKMKGSMLSIIVPFNVAYKISLDDTFSLMPYAGAYLKGNIWGEMEVDYSYTDSYGYTHKESNKLDLFDEDEGDGERFQYGLQFGLAVCIDKYVVSLGYQKELNEVMEDTDSSAWKLSVGVNF